MRKPRISLRTGMSTVIVLCWLAPILLLVTVFGFLLGESYQRSARQEMNDNAQFALSFVLTLWRAPSATPSPSPTTA